MELLNQPLSTNDVFLKCFCSFSKQTSAFKTFRGSAAPTPTFKKEILPCIVDKWVTFEEDQGRTCLHMTLFWHVFTYFKLSYIFTYFHIMSMKYNTVNHIVSHHIWAYHIIAVVWGRGDPRTPAPNPKPCGKGGRGTPPRPKPVWDRGRGPPRECHL